jgi:hypothetical protein
MPVDMQKKITRKLKIARALLHDEGSLAVMIRSLEFVQKKTKRNSRSSSAVRINTGAIYDEILTADPKHGANISWAGKADDSPLTFNWLMPPPGKGSGGHMTIFRFIQYLERAGHSCRIYLHNPGPGSSVEAVKAVMGDSFPKVHAQMSWLKQDEEMADADGLFATSWQTAYTVYNSKVTAKKFYFVQDFEPFFYPVGGFSVLAENTYRLGLRGITAGGWLSKKLNEQYGMITDHFDFGSDSKIYTYQGNKNRKQVVYYARPTTERRAFELGILTLDIFHRLHPDYDINIFGWDVSIYDIPFPYNNLGILDPEELNKVYNRCAASLVMSLTNMSLVPLEVLSSGCIPIVTEGDNNRLVSDNTYITYAMPDPVSLATALSQTVSRPDLDRYSAEASKSVASLDWDTSGDLIVPIIETSTRTAGIR